MDGGFNEIGTFNFNNTQPPPATNGILSLFSLKGKTAIISGAAAGIGLLAAQTYAEAGANVVLWYNSNKAAIERAEEIEKKYNVKAKAYQVNVKDAEAVANAVDTAVRDFNGRLDILVANSAIVWTKGAMTDAPISHYRDVMETNMDGVFYCARAAGNHWRRQKAEGTDINGNKLENFSLGSFIVTASISGHIVNIPQYQAAYNASKAAAIHFCKSIAIEWVKFARANIISPGYIDTEIANFVPREMMQILISKVPMGRQGLVHEMGGAYLYLASDASSYTTGADILVDGGYCAH